MGFEWDDSKAANNFSKHGVSFEEAKTVPCGSVELFIFLNQLIFLSKIGFN
jgi:uncharacterized DUF497 family protein